MQAIRKKKSNKKSFIRGDSVTSFIELDSAVLLASVKKARFL